MKLKVIAGACLFTLMGPLASAEAQNLTEQAINEAKLSDKASARARVAKLQILLDRAGFSPGVIDGRPGENVDNALAAFRAANDLQGKEIDAATWDKLGGGAGGPAIVEYTITESDLKGPFVKEIPEGFEEKKELDRLAYTGPAEALAEKFHMDEDFLGELNKGKDFGKAGTTILVANVAEEGEKAGAARRIEVDKAKKQVRAYGENDRLLGVYPATIGSESRPAPSGTHEVTAVARDPNYTYNPKYKFEGVKTDKPFRIAPGPNNPVGSTWIDLGGDGYGIHGSPEPAEIGKTASHGCVRLTNWDAEALAKMVKPGVKVKFIGT